MCFLAISPFSFFSPADVSIAATPALSAGFCFCPPERRCQWSMSISPMRANFAALKMKAEFGFTFTEKILSQLFFPSISFILCAILCVLSSNQKTVDSPILEIGFMCSNLLIQCSNVVMKLTLYPHLVHLDLAIEQLLCTCSSFNLCEIHPEAFLQELSDVL